MFVWGDAYRHQFSLRLSRIRRDAEWCGVLAGVKDRYKVIVCVCLCMRVISEKSCYCTHRLKLNKWNEWRYIYEGFIAIVSA